MDALQMLEEWICQHYETTAAYEIETWAKSVDENTRILQNGVNNAILVRHHLYMALLSLLKAKMNGEQYDGVWDEESYVGFFDMFLHLHGDSVLSKPFTTTAQLKKRYQKVARFLPPSTTS